MKKILVLSTILIFSCTKKSGEEKAAESMAKANYSFSGIILDCNNQAIVGATVIFDGYDVQTITTPTGEWNLNAAGVAPCNEVCNLKVTYNGSETIVPIDSYDSISTDDAGLSSSVKTSKLIKLDTVNPGLNVCPDSEPVVDQTL